MINSARLCGLCVGRTLAGYSECPQRDGSPLDGGSIRRGSAEVPAGVAAAWTIKRWRREGRERAVADGATVPDGRFRRVHLPPSNVPPAAPPAGTRHDAAHSHVGDVARPSTRASTAGDAGQHSLADVGFCIPHSHCFAERTADDFHLLPRAAGGTVNRVGHSRQTIRSA